MFATNQNRRIAAALLASVAILLAGCGAAAAPTWTYTPLTVDTSTAAPSAAASASAAAPSPSAPSPSADTATPAPSAAALNGATVTLSEWKVAMTATVKAGKATFTIANAGTTHHELLVFKSDQAPSAYPTNPAGGIVEDGAGVTLLSDGENIDPGKTQQRTVVLAPGTYLFVCNIPGHFNQGMFTVVTVTQ
jgi:uncharacterized cupredoxin-like copper-binding protein